MSFWNWAFSINELYHTVHSIEIIDKKNNRGIICMNFTFIQTLKHVIMARKLTSRPIGDRIQNQDEEEQRSPFFAAHNDENFVNMGAFDDPEYVFSSKAENIPHGFHVMSKKDFNMQLGKTEGY